MAKKTLPTKALEPSPEQAPTLSAQDTKEPEPVMAEPEEPTSNPVDALRVEREDLQAELADTERQRMALQAKEKELTAKIDRLIVKLEKAEAPQPTMTAIQAYILKQNEVRVARYERRMDLIDSGADADELKTVASPIDQALARNRSRNQRPVRQIG
jgi:hypothetical protein